MQPTVVSIHLQIIGLLYLFNNCSHTAFPVFCDIAVHPVQKELYKNIESLWLDATNAQQQYDAAESKLKSSRISFDMVNEQFNLGMKNTVELLTEKNNLLQAQQEQLQAKYMAILNMQLLKFYQGDQLAI